MTAIKIPDQYYMGRRKDGLAFITPEGKDKAAVRRKDTVNNWAHTREFEWQDNPEYDPTIVADGKKIPWGDIRTREQIQIDTCDDSSTYKTFDNSPQSGFKLCKVVGRWCTANKAFEIEDPRGFRIQIYSNNLVEICQQAGIKGGMLLGSYVYGREGANNVLLPIGSQIYRDAKQLTSDITAKKISIKDISIGDQVDLLYQNNRIPCLYVGRNYHLQTVLRATPVVRIKPLIRRRYQQPEYEYNWVDKIGRPRHGFIDLRPGGGLLEPSKANILSITHKGFKSLEEAKAALDAYNGECFKDHTPSKWELNWGYDTKPTRASVYSLSRAHLKDIVATREEELKAFTPVHVKGRKR